MPKAQTHSFNARMIQVLIRQRARHERESSQFSTLDPFRIDKLSGQSFRQKWMSHDSLNRQLDPKSLETIRSRLGNLRLKNSIMSECSEPSNIIKLMLLGSGSSKAVERTPRSRDIVGSIPGKCWAFFFFYPQWCVPWRMCTITVFSFERINA